MRPLALLLAPVLLTSCAEVRDEAPVSDEPSGATWSGELAEGGLPEMNAFWYTAEKTSDEGTYRHVRLGEGVSCAAIRTLQEEMDASAAQLALDEDYDAYNDRVGAAYAAYAPSPVFWDGSFLAPALTGVGPILPEHWSSDGGVMSLRIHQLSDDVPDESPDYIQYIAGERYEGYGEISEERPNGLDGEITEWGSRTSGWVEVDALWQKPATSESAYRRVRVDFVAEECDL